MAISVHVSVTHSPWPNSFYEVELLEKTGSEISMATVVRNCETAKQFIYFSSRSKFVSSFFREIVDICLKKVFLKIFFIYPFFSVNFPLL